MVGEEDWLISAARLPGSKVKVLIVRFLDDIVQILIVDLHLRDGIVHRRGDSLCFDAQLEHFGRLNDAVVIAHHLDDTIEKKPIMITS